MSSSSMSFQPPAQGVFKPPDRKRANNPFYSATQGMQFQPYTVQARMGSFNGPGGMMPIPQAPLGYPAPLGQPNGGLAKPNPGPGKEQESKAKINPIGYMFPVMTLIGTPLMLLTSLMGVSTERIKDNLHIKYEPGRLSTKMLNKLPFKPTQAHMVNTYKLGRGILALGIIPKTIIGVMYGIQAQQPSILISHLLQLPLTPLILKEKRLATTLVYMMGGMFTLGFINDVENGQKKDGLKGAHPGKQRLYDMGPMKQVFSSDSGLSVFKRMTRFISEAAKMVAFSAQDHWLTGKRAVSEVKKLINGEKNELTDLKSTGSISKSSLGFLLCYAATIPALISAMKLDSQSGAAKWVSKYSMGTTMLSGLMLNFGMILVALSGKNWAERIPMAGTTMELSGTVAGYSTNSKIQPFAVALQQLGGGLNNIFFANKAQKKDTSSENGQP